MIHLYCGDGKGKTTAAMGLALRMLGNQKKVLLVQFLKDGSSGELLALSMFDNVTIHTKLSIPKFYMQMSELERSQTKQEQTALLEIVSNLGANYDLIVLDEIVDTLNLQIVSQAQVCTLLDTLKDTTEIVLTGRNPSDGIVLRSDYYTQFKAHKHPFQQGIQARKGVEY